MEAGLAPSPPKLSHASYPSIIRLLGPPQPQGGCRIGPISGPPPCPFVQGLTAGTLLSPRMPGWTCLVEAWGKQLQEQKAGCLCWEVNDYPPCGSQGCTHGASPHPWVIPAPALPWVPLLAVRLLHPCAFGKKTSVLGTERRVLSMAGLVVRCSGDSPWSCLLPCRHPDPLTPGRCCRQRR